MPDSGLFFLSDGKIVSVHLFVGRATLRRQEFLRHA
jgi:hypothetical protein